MSKAVCALCAVGLFLIVFALPGSSQATTIQFTATDLDDALGQGEISGSTAMWSVSLPSP